VNTPLRTSAILLLMFAATQNAMADLYPLSIEERTAGAERIAIGTVVAQHPFWVDERGVMTAHYLEVDAWLKGWDNTTEIVVLSAGGVLGNRATIVQPSLHMERGLEYLVFLDRQEARRDDRTLRQLQPQLWQSLAFSDTQGALPMQDGHYLDVFGARYAPADVTARIATQLQTPALTPQGALYVPPYVSERDPFLPQVINTIAPNPTRAGTIVNGDFITISGTAFGASAGTVFYRSADVGSLTFLSTGVASDNVSWSDTSVVNKPASRAGTGPIRVNAQQSAGNLSVDYAHTDINSNFSGFAGTTRQRYYLRNLNGTGGMSLRYNTGSGFAGNAAAVASFERALSTWRCQAGIHFAPGGTTSNGLNGMDGVNSVLFDTLGAGTLGVATSNFSGNANGGCNLQNTVWTLADLDIQFQTGVAWQFGPGNPSASESDFESVALHEVGHGLGLGHRVASGETMHFQISNGATARTPAAQEILGAQAKMNYSDDATCFNPTNTGTPMVPVAPASCNLAGNSLIFSNGFE